LWGTPWSGHGWGQPFRRRSPLVAHLFRGLTRFCAHMYLPAAVPGRYLWTHEKFASDMGTVGCFLAAQEDNSYHDAIRSVRLNFREHGVDPLSLEVIDQARRKARSESVEPAEAAAAPASRSRSRAKPKPAPEPAGDAADTTPAASAEATEAQPRAEADAGDA
jgi:hypothetical protein